MSKRSHRPRVMLSTGHLCCHHGEETFTFEEGVEITIEDGFDELDQAVALEALWQSWGGFIYEDREAMWKGRRKRPLWDASVAVGLLQPPEPLEQYPDAVRLRDEWRSLCPVA